jgi:hypothetical protein
MINSKEISIIIQGGINPEITIEAINSARLNFPFAEIIISTWENADITKIDDKKVDKIILSKDPGGRIYSSCGVVNNVARQIESTKNGLHQATRKYALKTRSDIIIHGTEFTKYFAKYRNFKSEYKIFDEKIIICNLYTASSEKVPMLFHPSDWISFGYTHDILKLWDIPIPSDEIYFRFFNNLENKNNGPHPTLQGKFVPEQYIAIKCIEKYLPSLNTIKHYYDFNDELLLTHKYFLSSNFVVLDYRNQLEIEFRKYNPAIHAVDNQMDFSEWIEMYNSCTNSNVRVPHSVIVRKKSNSFYKAIKKYIRHPRKNLVKILEHVSK